MDSRCQTPVTLIFFNRPDTLRQVFEQICKARPYKLYLVQDGPRADHPEDFAKVMECRQIVQAVNWDCQVFCNFSEENLGCGVRPQSGISWTLSQEERTIILEDDCVPDPTFFRYCDELLERYKDDTRVSYISGLNHFEEWDFGKNSYGFAKQGAIWGWATWRRAWRFYDYAVSSIDDPYLQKQLSYIGMKPRVQSWLRTNQLVKQNAKLSYWDIQWGFVKHTQNQLVVVPKNNLIRNIGVGADSTHGQSLDSRHVKYRDYNNMPTAPMRFPMTHPDYMICDKMYDDLLVKCNKRINSRTQIIKRKISGIVRGARKNGRGLCK